MFIVHIPNKIFGLSYYHWPNSFPRGYASLYMQPLQCNENLCTITTVSASQVPMDTCMRK